MYEDFAAVYDQLMDDVDYGGWATYYLELMKRSNVTPKRMVDCACGTGNMAIRFASLGMQVTGLDLSADMLRCAFAKAKKECLQIPFIQQDMRKIRLHRPVDAMVCACDGVNYLRTLADVEQFFQVAFDALRPGGGLFFDVSSPYKLETQLGNQCLCEEREQISYLWVNHMNPHTHVVQMDLTFFARETDGRYRRFTETHYQRAHTVEELRGHLQKAGFTSIQAYGDHTFDEPMPETLRIHMAALRPEP